MGLVTCLFLASGCSNESKTAYPQWGSAPYPAQDGAAGGEEVLQIGSQAAVEAGASLSQIRFTPAQAKAIDAKLAPFLTQLGSLFQKPCSYSFQTSDPFAPQNSLLGLSLIGKVLSWRILNDLSSQNGNDAIRMFILGTRIGFLLNGGDAQSAIIGDQIADGVRKALMSNLLSLGASQLEALASQTESALEARPAREITVQNENATLLRIVEAIQTDVRNNKLDDLSRVLGQSARTANDALDQLPNQSPSAQIAFFSQLAGQAQIQGDWLKANSTAPKSKRSGPPDFKGSRKAPWVSIARSLFTTGNSWLEIDDATLARTRLLILYSLLEVQLKTGKIPPKSLAIAPGVVQFDPYTGRPFFYVPSAHSFLIYSAGENGLDDGGSTDPTFTSPDLFLENTR